MSKKELSKEEEEKADDYFSLGIDAFFNEKYKEAIEYYDLADQIAQKPYCETHRQETLRCWAFHFLKQGEFELCKEKLEEAKFTVLDVLWLFQKYPEKSRKKIEEMASNLLANDCFFSRTVKQDEQNRDLYAKIYIRSLQLVAKLHVTDNYEEQYVAHYTCKAVAEKLLLPTEKEIEVEGKKTKVKQTSPFRLNSIVNANDPEEGKPLLKYFGLVPQKEMDEYQAFVGCFIFDPDSLNQFRLYGKEDGREATGVSLMVGSWLFNSSLTINSEIIRELKKQDSLTDDTFVEDDSCESLFRCIYLDPETRQVISVGHKDAYRFYRDKMYKGQRLTDEEVKEIDERIASYQKYIKGITADVKAGLNSLNTFIKYRRNKLNHDIVCELLTHLRYLVKHAAFKEEQECRVIKVERLDSDIVKVEENKRMYIDYKHIDLFTNAVFFAPKAEGYKLFKDLLIRECPRYFPIQCYQCEHPFK